MTHPNESGRPVSNRCSETFGRDITRYVPHLYDDQRPNPDGAITQCSPCLRWTLVCIRIGQTSRLPVEFRIFDSGLRSGSNSSSTSDRPQPWLMRRCRCIQTPIVMESTDKVHIGRQMRQPHALSAISDVAGYDELSSGPPARDNFHQFPSKLGTGVMRRRGIFRRGPLRTGLLFPLLSTPGYDSASSDWQTFNPVMANQSGSLGNQTDHQPNS